MAGGKETPRQKMIGMMYLVLTALLALNVSKQILDAFVAIEENSQNSAMGSVIIGTNGVGDLKTNLEEKTDAVARAKVQALIDVAKDIDKLTAAQVKLIDDAKMEILKECGEDISVKANDPLKIVWTKTDGVKPARMHLMAVANKEEYDKPMHLLLGGESDIKKPVASALGMKIFDGMAKFRCSLVDMLGTYTSGEKLFSIKSESLNTFKDQNDLDKKMQLMFAKYKVNPEDDADLKKIYASLSLPSRVDTDETKDIHWVGKTFDHSPVVAALASLTSLQQSVLAARADAIGILKERAGAGEYSFNKVMPLAYGPSSVNNGEEFEVKVMMAAYDTDNNPVVANAKEIKDGVAIVSGRGSGSEVNMSGKISIRKKDGTMKTSDWSTTIRVMKPQGNVSLPEMNMLYRNYDNQVEAVASGYETTSITGSGVTLSAKGGGKWVGRCSGAGREASITVSGKSGDKSASLGTFKFRVSNLPGAAVKFGNIGNGEQASASSVKSNTKLFAGYGPEIPLNVVFTVTSWEMMVQGAPRPIKGSGNTLSSEAINYLKQARAGGQVSFSCNVSGGGMSRRAGCVINVQ